MALATITFYQKYSSIMIWWMPMPYSKALTFGYIARMLVNFIEKIFACMSPKALATT